MTPGDISTLRSILEQACHVCEPLLSVQVWYLQPMEMDRTMATACGRLCTTVIVGKAVANTG